MTASRRGWANRFEFLWVLIGFHALVVGGCSKPESEVTVCVKEPIPATADEAVRNVLADLQRQELPALWEFLPPSYRNDVEKLVRELGERIDDKTWEPFVATLQKARSVTSDLISQSKADTNEPDNELVARLRHVEQFLIVVCESELNNVAHLRRFDGHRFLKGTGSRLLSALSGGAFGDVGLAGDSFSQFGEVKVELTNSSGDTAVLTVQWPGQEPTQHKFVCVENHWIPQTLAEAWPTEFSKVREQCLAWADELRTSPEPWHARLREVNGLLDQLAATKSLAETQQVWQTGVSHLAVEWLGATTVEPSKADETPIVSPPPTKPARIKKPDTEVLLPDETQK